VRLLVVGNPHLAPALRALGHAVCDALVEHPDLCVPGVPFDVATLLARAGGTFDAVIVADALGPPALPYGLEHVDLPRLFWAIDVHVNLFWQRHFARCFDLVLVAQRDYLPQIEAEGVPAHWLPWGIDTTIFHDAGRPRVHDLAFVGRLSAHRRKRSRILAHLAARFPHHAFATDPRRALDWAETAAVYQQARIVIGESMLDDLTFRVFEGMACGALVLAERAANGLTTLFPPGEVLDVFGPDDLVEKTAWWLAHDAERAEVAARGAALIAARHDMRHRMAEVCALLGRGVPRRDTRGRGGRDWALAAYFGVARGLMEPARTIPHVLAALASAFAAGDVDGLLAIAELAAITGEVERARRLLDHVGRMAPDDPRPAALAAALAARAGDPIDASAALAVGRALEAYGLGVWVGFAPAPGFDLPRTAWDWYLRGLAGGSSEAALRAGELALGAGCIDAAVEVLSRAVELAPADAHARARLATARKRAYCCEAPGGP